MKHNRIALVFAGLAFLTFLGFLRIAWQLSLSGPAGYSLEWIPELQLSFSFFVDGLTVLFALLVSGIGTLIFIYSYGYFHGDSKAPRSLIILFCFFLSMLGLVLSDNLLLMFIFWELTSITSYLLIGHTHEKEEARAAALQALLVTGGGGLALLLGIILIGMAAGTLELSELIQRQELLTEHALYFPILLLVLLGAFTKSAQIPFHFWLPGAMAAPTPISAYLHSATMVNAGVYLMARLHPVLGGTLFWHYLIVIVGIVTMFTGAAMALGQKDLKRLLAYTTVSGLGILTFLLGVGTTLAVKAAMVFLVVHSMYKASLFMIVGIIDHETGTRDLGKLGGLAKVMPITFVAAVLSALSMSGMPPLLGFISKELFYEAHRQAPWTGPVIGILGLFGNAFTATAALMVGFLPFLRKVEGEEVRGHEPPVYLWIGALLLGVLGLLMGLFPTFFGNYFLEPAFVAIKGEPSKLHLKLWHGVNPVFIISVVTLCIGFAVFYWREKVFRWSRPLKAILPYGPSRAYEIGLSGVLRIASWVTAIFQTGSLHRYVAITLGVLVLTVGASLLEFRLPERPTGGPVGIFLIAVVILIVIPSVSAIFTHSRLASVLQLGCVGLGVTLLFAVYSAPDLAVTQMLVETLTLVLFVLVVNRLPEYVENSTRMRRLGDFALALFAGFILTVVTYRAVFLQYDQPISDYFAKTSLTEAFGRNVVNVILVDFRAIDTMGEITVVMVAAIGVFALLKMPRAKGE